MKWIDVAFVAVFLTNFIFMAGAAMALMKIVQATQSFGSHLRDVIGESIDVTKDLKRASKRITNDLDKWSQESLHNDAASGKSLAALSRQMADLQDLLHARLAAPEPSKSDSPQGQDKDQDKEVTQRLRDKLREVLEKNMKLQVELDQVTYKMRGALKSHDDVAEGVQEIKGVHPQTVKELGLRMEQLKLELSVANTRAVAAERLASESAQRLLELQTAFNSNRFNPSASEAMQLDTLQQQNQAMINRERELLTMLDAVKAELQRNLTEKGFIEDRFVELDTRISDDTQ
jgi:hypothetical protein